MMTVREVAEVICRWEGANRGLDPNKMELEHTFWPENSYYYGFWPSEVSPDSNRPLIDSPCNSFDLAVKGNCRDKEIQVTPADVEAMLEMTGVQNTWQTLIPTGWLV